MRYKRLWVIAALGVAAHCGPGRAAVTEDSFQIRSTGDLVDLCTASPSDPMGTAALNFCQGFGVGAYRVLDELNRARKTPMFCMPGTLPTRNEALASFVRWAKSNPDQLGAAPQDGIAAFLSSQYPCGHKK
jgi:hypothetical protein